MRLVVEGQGAEALRRLPAVEAAHPEPARLLLRLGQALALGRALFDAARALGREALRLQPDYPQARGLLQALERAR